MTFQKPVRSKERKTLAQALDILEPTTLWKRWLKFANFSSLINARNCLSVQIHPTNKYALHFEEEYGKIEMLYVPDFEQRTKLLCDARHTL